jgi:acyl-CoA synthetase (AMP-forming)/AMP-acid ligase II
MNDLLGSHRPGSIAIMDADRGEETTYGQLVDRVTGTADLLRREVGRGLVFQVATNTAGSIVVYLACLELGWPVGLLDPGRPDRLESLVRAYRPVAVLAPVDGGLPAAVRPGPPLADAAYRVGLGRADGPVHAPHPELALLLTTSGSTGSPKLVRLARRSVLANARSIVTYLGIEPGERSIQSLPMHYSYGLSLVNSHLTAGATVVLTQHSFLRPEFWGAFDRTGCTSLAGVPYVYETLHRLRFDPRRHPSLRTMTQAGGALRSDLIRSFRERVAAARGRLFVMYGQTEACARISYVPWERLGEKIGSIGIPVPDGYLTVAPVADSDHHELVYRGPNVMMGYAESADDLAAGDELKGTLRTGDLATVDDEGFFYLTGRLTRFAKLFGYRISLEDIEKGLEARYPVDVAATDGDGQLVIYAAARAHVDLEGIGQYLAQQLTVPRQCIRVRAVPQIPLTASGKKDYKALAP